MIDLIVRAGILLVIGALIGLVPFFVGRCVGKPGWGRLGWMCSMISGLLFLSVPVAIGFTIAAIVCRRDYTFRRAAAHAPAAPAAVPQAYAPHGTGLCLMCIAGPLKGQTYSLNGEGIMIGRDYDCAVRFASDAPGISRHHCSLRWQNGRLMLTDLNSAYGTFMADGRKLPPQYPLELAQGSSFYLANTGYMFQIA